MEVTATRRETPAMATTLLAMKRLFLMFGIIGTAVAGGFAVSRLDASRDALIVATVGAVLLAPIAIRVAQRRFDPLEPIVMFSVAFGAMFVVRPFAMLVEGDFVYGQSMRAIAVRETFAEMMTLAAVGAVAFIVAYGLPIGPRIAAGMKVPAASFHTDRVVVGALATAGAGIALTMLFLVSAGEGLGLIVAGRSAALTDAYRSSTAYLSTGPYLLAPSALILFAVGQARARKGLIALSVAITLILLWLTVPTGSRMLLLPFFGGALVYHYVSRKTRPRIVTLGVIILVSLFISTVLHDARIAGDGRSGGFRETASSTLHHPEQMAEPLTGGSDAAMAPLLAVALKVVPEELGFMHGGATAGDFVTRPIPRELWDKKPLSPREAIISRLWPTEYFHRATNPEFSVLLYFYLDFALLGVVVGMALYGVMARLIYEYFRLHGDSLTARLLFSISVPFIAIALRDSPVDTFVRAVFIVAPVLLVFRFAAKRSPRMRQA